MPLALHFLSGKNKGKETLLPYEGELLVGRTQDEDVVIDDDQAPHLHARITVERDKVVIKDLETGGGTLVNRKNVTECKLREGDRIRVGKVTFMLVSVNRFSTTPGAAGGKPSAAEAVAASSKGLMNLGSSISGSIRDVPLIDILQFLGNARKTGELVITSHPNVGHVYLWEGEIYYAKTNTVPATSPKKALFRLARWKSGTFTFGPQPETEVPAQLNEPSQNILLDAAQAADALSELEAELPPLRTRLTAPQLEPGQLRDLTPAEQAVHQLVRQHGVLRVVLDNYPDCDLEGCQIIRGLLQRNLIVAS